SVSVRRWQRHGGAAGDLVIPPPWPTCAGWEHMTALEAARRYLRNGLAVVPIPIGQKAPVIRGWPRLRLNEAELSTYFSGPGILGVLNGEPMAGLIDIDVDASEALAVADALLPATDLVFGRPSKPRSHRVYRVEFVPATKQFQDVDEDRTMLVELRSTGSQTVWPPSMHPSGEAVGFHREGEPAVVSNEVLCEAVALVASTALLARHWPRTPGSRHAISLALAGYLLRGGLLESVVAQVVGLAARVAGDEEAGDRSRSVRDTATRLAAGKVKGGPTLAHLLGDGVVATLGRWLNLHHGDREGGASAGAQSQSSLCSLVSRWPEPLAPEAYYGLAGDIVRTIAPHTEAAEEALLVQLLVAYGSVIGRNAHFVAEADR